MSYDLVKVFDLSAAPAELREADDLQLLRPTVVDCEETTMLLFSVGSKQVTESGSSEIAKEITYAEHLLERWLSESGAAEGETVLVTWKSGAPANSCGELPK